MNRRNRVALASAAAAAGGAAGALALGAAVWDRATARAVARLGQTRKPDASSALPSQAVADRPDFAASPYGRLTGIIDLPDPVARYFAFAITARRPFIRSARVEHHGHFRTAPDAAWSPFRSVQHISADPPGFVWDARIRMAPLTTVRVRDSYIAGRAAMLGKVAALVPVVRQQGTPELAAGALHRWLAEATWIPTALLPRPGLEWQAIDQATARVTVTDGATTVSLDAHFDAAGGIGRVEARRFRDVDGAGVLTPFVGYFSDYVEVEGVRIPAEGRVEWILPTGPFSYWRGRLTRIVFDPAR